MKFLSASRRLHEEATGLAALAGGGRTQDARDALMAVLAYARQMQRHAEANGQALLALRNGAGAIRSAFSTFRKLVMSFRITAIASRIEVAHLDTSQQNLESLADDVGSCIEGIEALGIRILEAVAGFDAQVASTLDEVGRLEASRLEELPALLAETSADLDAFRIRGEEAERQASKLAEELDSVIRELGAIAVSIQFHDITRQRVEQVISALEGLVREDSVLARGDRLSSSGRAAARLQKAQLQSAAAFTDSTNKIALELKGIASRVTEMASGVGSSERESPDDKASFFCAMEARFSALARTVSELDAVAVRTRATVAELRETSARLSGAVQGVQSMESQLSHISINAMVSAHHLGAQGGALHVIAGAIQELRKDCRSRSSNASAALDSIRR